MTCRRDRLREEVPGIYLHKDKKGSKQKAKVARFYHHVVAVKSVTAVPYKKVHQRVHVSFKSISSYNISIVNAL